MHAAGSSAETHPNRLLAALPEPLQNRLLGKMDLVSLSEREVLYEQGGRMDYAFFPCTALISLISSVEEGSAVEVATVGSEGFLGLPLYFGMQAAFARGIVQTPGEARRIPSQLFHDEVERNDDLNEAVRSYCQTLIVQMSRSAACNRLHSLEQRCARWLLSTQDRTDRDDCPVTQEFVAEILGVTRPSATTMLHDFERSGWISLSRGSIRIVDRHGLEAVACECYGVLKKEFERPLSEESSRPSGGRSSASRRNG